MKTTYFLVIALLAIFHFVTGDLVVIQLWNTSFADSDNAIPITRSASVDLQCSKFLEHTLKITTFNELHVGNYQCRVFPSSGPEIWRSIALCMAKVGGNKSTSDESFGSTCSEMSRSSPLQVIKFNRLRKSYKILKQEIDSEITDLKKVKSFRKMIKRTNARLECPFDEKKDSLIWMVHSRLDYDQLEKYNNGHINTLNVDRQGRYECLVGNGSGYVRHRFVVKALPMDNNVTDGPTAIDAAAGPRHIDVQLMVFIVCSVFLLFAATAALLYFLRKSKCCPIRKRIPSPHSSITIDSKKRPTTYLDLFNVKEISQNVEPCSKSDVRSLEESDCETHIHPEFIPWRLRPDNLKLGDILRENNSYTLYRARLVNLSAERSINVAVKMSKAGTTDSELLDLVAEMKIMKSVGKHLNVIGLMGTCDQTDALFFVMEFAVHGNLRDHLRERGSSLRYEYTHKTESENERLSVHIDLVSYALQVARGMGYLASRRCVHRDLRAKRVLMSKGGILKIADYATKRIRRRDYNAVARDNNRLLVRWMAPETLFRGIHTTEANVWSYGILLWEIMTFAATPYPLILTTEELAARLKLGYYMENPKGCPKDIYKLMGRCWNESPARRPRFEQLVENLDEIWRNLSEQMKRLESGNHQQEEYANATRQPSSKLNYDSEYDDIVHVTRGIIEPA